MSESKGRKTPRRLFSFDSIKTARTNASDTASLPDDESPSRWKHKQAPSASMYSLEETAESPKDLTTPTSSYFLPRRPQSPKRPRADSPHRAGSPLRGERKPPTLPQVSQLRSSSPDSAQYPRSPSSARWDHIRQHVLPTPRSASPTRPSRPASPRRPSSPHIRRPSSPLQASRSQQPAAKPSRLARLGFRQVVESAKEAAVDDSRRFVADIHTALAASLIPEKSAGGSRLETHSAPGSTLYLPFMSTTSLASSAQQHSTEQSSDAGFARQTVKPILQALTAHAMPGTDGYPRTVAVPLEGQILSALLKPFLSTERGQDQEQWFALESFLLITATWPPRDEATAVERLCWCCKAALLPSAYRDRVVGALWQLAGQGRGQQEDVDAMGSAPLGSYALETPHAVQTFVQALFGVLPNLHAAQSGKVIDTEESRLAKDIIKDVMAGACGEVDANAVEEAYGALYVKQDSVAEVHRAVCLEALAKCVENSSEATRRWLLRYGIEAYWQPDESVEAHRPLPAIIHASKLNTFTRALLAMVNSEPTSTTLLTPEGKVSAAQLAMYHLQRRVVDELARLSDTLASEARSNVVRIAFELLCISGSRELMQWAAELVGTWHANAELRVSVERTMKDVISKDEWPRVLAILSAVMRAAPEPMRKPLATYFVPVLNDRLVEDPPAASSAPLSALLDLLSRTYPQVFFKPLFACAAATRELAVAHHLAVLRAVSKFVPEFWTRDAEMVAVALMSEPGGRKESAGESAHNGEVPWGVPRLGQTALMVEVISRIQEARRMREVEESENPFMDSSKFVVGLETRLSVLIEAKEQKALLPPIQRVLLSVLLRECRLYTRSLKPASWLSKCVSWFVKYETDESVRQRTDEEVKDYVEQIRALYMASEAGAKLGHSRRSTMVLHTRSGSMDTTIDGASGLLKEKEQLLRSVAKGFAARILKLLVTMAVLLSRDHVEKIGTYLWANYLDEREAPTLGPACFLVMQCAEKAPRDLIATIEVDMQSSDESTRVLAAQRFGLLVNYRFQILSQQVIMDRAHRPFKLARGPLPFVAADIGSNKFVLETNASDVKDALPAELKKRLAEIGWAQDDSPVDQRLEWAQTPLSILPSYQADRFDLTVDRDATPMPSPNNSPAASPQRPGQERGRSASDSSSISPMLLRRNSSTGGPIQGAKRRPVFVPSLTSVFPDLVMLVFDQSFAVASAARAVVLDLMRNDPALLLRPLLDFFVAESRDMPRATTTLRALLHVHQHTPPSLAFQLFNNIIGYLKHNTRHLQTQDPLNDFAAVLGIAAKLVTQVSRLSIREMRRAKIEPFMIPSGSLWFPPSAPAGYMFPRAPSHYNPFTYDPDLVHITTIRIAQNSLLLSMLKRTPQDVQLVRRTMTRLVLPIDSTPTIEPPPLEMKDFVPRKRAKGQHFKSADEVTMAALSSMLSRSYVLLVAQIFRCLPRHLNDREELSVLIDGLNRVLLAHGDDIGILAHTLIAFMVASTRFRRLFTSGGGYTMFMPALLKVYTENEVNSGIRSAIDYAADRFWALHREVFIFQTLDVMSHVLMVPKVNATWICENIFQFFWTLHQVTPPSRSTDAAGIHDQNKEQEREALLVSTAEETPQAFLAALRNDNQLTKVDIPEEFEAKKPHIENFIRLFLTVIAHDPTIRRAEQFLRAFRHMASSLYARSHPGAGAVLRDGIDALSMVLLKLTSKAKATEAAQPSTTTTRTGDDSDSVASADALLESAPVLDNTKGTSDVLSMRLDYLHLVVAYAEAGGDLPSSTMQHVVDVFRIVFQDTSGDVRDAAARIFCSYTKAMLWRDQQRTVKEVIAFLKVNTPIISAFAGTLDFSGVFDTLAHLASNPLYASDKHFAHLVTNQVCAAGLAACEQAASQNLLITLTFRASLINLISKVVHMQNADVLWEIERCTPSHDFLAHIVLPLVMTLPTGQGHLGEAHMGHAGSNAIPSAWMRLLAYAMTAKQVTSGRSKVEHKRRSQSSSTPHVPTFVFILQVIKVIVVRAETILSSSLPGVWNRLATFLMSTLDDGDAAFATSYLRSPTHSPLHSPRASLEVYNPMLQSNNPFMQVPERPRTFKSPRAVDYALWSFLELLAVYRSPLLLQMRIFMQEKVLAVNHDLRQQHGPGGARGSRRVSSTAFSKPRRRLSGMPSPENSPKIGAYSYRGSRAGPGFMEDRQAGFHGFNDGGGGNPRIVHLGPVSRPPSPFARPASPSAEASRVTRIGSMVLVRATYERIRVVQSVLGYDEVLPMPGDGEEAPEVQLTTWTRGQALEAIAKETRLLIEEFGETFGDETVLVDGDVSMGA